MDNNQGNGPLPLPGTAFGPKGIEHVDLRQPFSATGPVNSRTYNADTGEYGAGAAYTPVSGNDLPGVENGFQTHTWQDRTNGIATKPWEMQGGGSVTKNDIMGFWADPASAVGTPWERYLSGGGASGSPIGFNWGQAMMGAKTGGAYQGGSGYGRLMADRRQTERLDMNPEMAARYEALIGRRNAPEPTPAPVIGAPAPTPPPVPFLLQDHLGPQHVRVDQTPRGQVRGAVVRKPLPLGSIIPLR